MKTRRNTAAMPSDAEAKRRLQKLIDALPLPPGANATVISARVRPYEYSGDYHDEEGHTLEYEVGGHTDLDADSTLARYRDHDLHRIVSDALGVRRGDEDALLEDADVVRDRRALRDYSGFSVIWSGTLLDRAVIHTDEGDKRADALPEVRAGKRNAGFMQKMLADMKANPRASERGAPKRARGDSRRPARPVPLTPSVFDKKNWSLAYPKERRVAGRPLMDGASLFIEPKTPFGPPSHSGEGVVHLVEGLRWSRPISYRVGTWSEGDITSFSFRYDPSENTLTVRYRVSMANSPYHTYLPLHFPDRATFVVTYGTMRYRLGASETLFRQYEKGPRGLEQAVKMARADLETRMSEGYIQIGEARPEFTARPSIELPAAERDEFDMAKDYLLKMRRDLARRKSIPEKATLAVTSDMNDGPLFREEVDELLAWYRSQTKTNPRARRVSTAVLGERVRVFRNLHTETWSVESATTGRIIAHPDTVLLEDVRLVSRDAGREEVRRTGKKNVHAIASGTLVAIDGPAPADLDRWVPLYYNPFKVDTFVEFVGGKVGKPVRGSRMWFAAADHRSQYALDPQEADPGRHKKPKAPRRENGFLASLALVGIGMAAGVYVEEQKGVAARVRRALKGKDKVAREQFDRLKRGVLEAKPRARETQPRPTLAIRTSAPITVRSSVFEAVTDPAWVREESPDGKGYTHARTMKGTPYEVFERVYGKGNKVVVLDVGEERERVNAPNGQDGWPSVAAAKRAAEALAGMRLASA